MSFGQSPKDASGVPLGAAVRPGNTTPLTLQGSMLSLTDSQSNRLTGVATSPALTEAVLNGQAYVAMYTQTIGAAQGPYMLSVFNPGNSGKNALICSIKTVVNFGNAFYELYKATTDPAYNTAVTAINMKIGGSASAMNITANSAAGSYPGGGDRMEISTSNPEIITNNMCIFIPPGKGSLILAYVGNSQNYVHAMKWIEFEV